MFPRVLSPPWQLSKDDEDELMTQLAGWLASELFLRGPVQ